MTATDRLLNDAVEFFCAHQALEGDYYDASMRTGVRGIMAATLAYLSIQARKSGAEDDLNTLLYMISLGDGR